MPRLIVSFLLVWLLSTPCSYAGDILSSKSLIVFAYNDRPSVSASLRREADFVSMPLSIRSDHKDASERFEVIGQAKAAILMAAAGNKGISVHSGPVVLSARPTSKLSFLSSGGYGNYSQAQLHVLVPLAESAKDVFQCAIEMNEFIKGVQLPDKAEIEFGQIHLAVDNPEQHREVLLKLISEEVAKSKAALGANGQVIVSGLESPVFVRQADERHVELFLNYSTSFTVSE